MLQVNKILLSIGISGVMIVAILNFYAVHFVGKASAVPFSSIWWGQWFILYLIMFSLLIIGLVTYLFRKQ